MPLQASAEAHHATLEALMEAVQNHAFTEGYTIVKARSKSNEFGNVVKVVLSCDRGGRGGRGGRSSKEIKKLFATDIAAVMKADIQAIEEASALMYRDVQAILTRVGVKAKTKGASNDFIVNTDKTVIEVSSDDEFCSFHHRRRSHGRSHEHV